jgi:hypothetical protein
MEIRVSHSRLIRRVTKLLLVVGVFFVGSIETSAQKVPNRRDHAQSHVARITAWNDHLVGMVRFLRVMFPDIDANSKTIVAGDRDWAHGGPIGSFAIYVCEPDIPGSTELEKGAFGRDDIQCSSLTLGASYLASGSQFGSVPGWIMVWRPAIQKRWSGTAALLIAHPEWSSQQVEEAMKSGGVRYGADARNEVIGPVHSALAKVEPFLGKLLLDSIDYSPQDLRDGKNPKAPAWVVRVHPSGQDKSKPTTSYTLIFNVFDGAFESEHIYMEPGRSETK